MQGTNRHNREFSFSDTLNYDVIIVTEKLGFTILIGMRDKIGKSPQKAGSLLPIENPPE
jgi:hypothetical protein